MQYLNYRLLGFKLYESGPQKESVCVLLDKVFQVFYFMFLPLWYVVNAFPPYFVTSSLCEKPICKYLREMVEMGCSPLFGSSHLYDSSNNLEHFWSFCIFGNMRFQIKSASVIVLVKDTTQLVPHIMSFLMHS